MSHHITARLEIILDKETRISHAAFAEQIEGRLGGGDGDNARGPDMKVWSKGRGLGDVSPIAIRVPARAYRRAGRLQLCRVHLHAHHPVAVNGQRVRLAFVRRVHARPPGAQGCRSSVRRHEVQGLLRESRAHVHRRSNEGGLALRACCAILTTPQEQERVYQLLLSLQTELLGKMADGIPAKDVFSHAVAFIREKNPDLEKHFVKNIGFGVRVSCLGIRVPERASSRWASSSVTVRSSSRARALASLRRAWSSTSSLVSRTWTKATGQSSHGTFYSVGWG